MNGTDLLDTITRVFTDLTTEVPGSLERIATDPAKRSRELTLTAASEAALVAGTLSLPPGPLGLVTVLPDLIAVWKIQRQLVADIAACHGKFEKLTSETMIYCLFRHAAAQLVRDLVVRAAERVLVRAASAQVIQKLLKRLGIVITQRVAGRSVSRWLPLVGAVGIGAYAFYDTAQVGKTSLKLFQSHLQLEAENNSDTTADVIDVVAEHRE